MAQAPAEFTGRARMFCAGILSADEQALRAIERITAPLRARCKRKPTLRPGQAVDVARAWREQMPAKSRLNLAIDLGTKRSPMLRIDETRVTAADFCRLTWGETAWEPGISISRVRLHIVSGALELDFQTPISYVGLHALARWYQRAWNTSEAALLGDLRKLSGWHAPASGWGEFRIDVTDGAWLGAFAEVEVSGQQVRILAVRSYLDADALAREVA